MIMAFYLRKGLNFGPLRLNLSKGGVGLSAGVTGARVGISPRGAYVHGGRKGVYYRKYMSGRKKKGVGTVGPSDIESDYIGYDADSENRSVRPGGTAEIFVNTGVTYPSPVRKSEMASFPAPDLTNKARYFKIGLFSGMLFILVSLLFELPFFFVFAGFVLIVFGAAVYLMNERKNKKAVSFINDFLTTIRGKDNSNRVNGVKEYLQKLEKWEGTQRKWLDFHIGYALQKTFTEKKYPGWKDLVRRFEDISVLTSRERKELYTILFQKRFEALAGDHDLTDEDERHLKALAQELSLGEAEIGEELDTLKVLSEIRKETESFPPEIKAPFNLSNREKCYAAVPGSLLKEKVQQYRTINRVRHKYIGYEIDMKGTLCLTDKRVLIVSEGTRSYSLNKIRDIILSLEDATVKLVLDGRKTPVIITLERPAVFAARMQHLLDAA